MKEKIVQQKSLIIMLLGLNICFVLLIIQEEKSLSGIMILGFTTCKLSYLSEY